MYKLINAAVEHIMAYRQLSAWHRYRMQILFLGSNCFAPEAIHLINTLVFIFTHNLFAVVHIDLAKISPEAVSTHTDKPVAFVETCRSVHTKITATADSGVLIDITYIAREAWWAIAGTSSFCVDVDSTVLAINGRAAVRKTE